MSTFNTVHIRSPKDITGKQGLIMIPLIKFYSQKKNIDELLSIVEGHTKISLRLIDWFVTNYSKKNNILYNINHYKPESETKTKTLPKSNRVLKCGDGKLCFEKIELIDCNDRKVCDGVSDGTILQRRELFDDYLNVYSDYKSQLKAYSKKHFDPFCRRERISFFYNTESSIITTVGQLNFFKWAIENYILDYIHLHFNDIENDMNEKSKLIQSQSFNQETEELSTLNTVIIDKPKKKTKIINQKKKTQRKTRQELSKSAIKTLVKHNVHTIISFD
jgi:hypothetical protein